MAQDVQGMLIRIEATSAQLRQELARAEKAVGASASKIDKELINVDRAVDRAMEAISASVAKAHAGLDQLGDNLSSTAVAAKSMTSAVSSAGNASAGAARGFHATAGAVNAAGLSAKQYSQAMRMLPMQLTDVVTSLASGMPIWMVAIQQGGQVRDSFGGIGAAARAAISAISPLTAAIGIAAASIGTLVYAYQGGQAEALAFNRAMTMTGNAAGTSVDVLMETASALDQVSGTQRQAAAALAEIVATGKIASDQFANVAAAAMAMEQATGKAVADTVKEFAALADEPAAASAKLNQQYNYLTASVYKQIAALEQQGDKLGAAKLAMEEYGRAAQERSDDIDQSLGYIDRALNGLKAGWREMWDAAFDIGRPETLEEKLAGVEQAINQRKRNIYVGSVFDWGPSEEELERQSQGIQLSIQQRDLDAAFISLRAQNAQQEIKAAKEERKATEQLDKSYGSMLASLRQTTALHGQASEVARVRYALENGELSKLTEAQKSALLAVAQEIDAKEAAAEAGRKNAAAYKEQIKEIDAVISRALPERKRLEDLSQAQEGLRAAHAAGRITADELALGMANLNEQYADPAIKEREKAEKKLAEALKKTDAQVQSVLDRLDPISKATREYADEQKLLTDAMKRYPERAAEYQRALELLGREYEDNKRKSSEWGQWTESALERVDSAFADAWRNIGDGFSSFRDSLTNAFKQMLAELAHLAITRPIVMQIGAALGIGGGTQGNNGIWGGLLGGGSGSGGGLDFGSLLRYGQTAYSMFTGVGPAVMAGWQSGGLTGAIQGGAGYYGNMLSGAASTVGSLFGYGGAAGSMAAGSTAAGYTGAAYANWAAGAQAGAGGLSAIAGNLGAIAGPVAGLYMALKGYGAISNGYDFKPKDFDDEFSGVRLGAKVINAYENGITKVFGDSSFLSKALRIPVATIGGLMSSVFGGGWETKNYGLAFSVANGDFLGQSYEDQKKKGGLFGSDKKRTKYRALDPETAAVLQETYDATQAGVADLFASLSLTVEEGSLDGLKLAREKISTKGKTEEEIQQAIAEWFGSAADAMTAELNKVFNTGLDLDLEGMQAFVGNLTGVNEVLRYLDVEMYDASVAGGKLAEALSAAAGGLEALATNSQTYYDAFFSAEEKTADTIDAITRAFESADVELAASREAYRAMVEDIDLTTEAGQEMFATLMALSGQAAQYYSILEQQGAALIGAAGSAYAALQRSIANQQQEIQRAASGTAAAISALTGVSNSLDAALKRLRGSSDDTVRMLRAQAVMTLNSALVTARAGGSLADYAGLQDALDVASNMDTSLYRSLEDFEREQGRTANLIAELEKVNGKQLSTEEQMLEQYEKQLSKLDEQLAFAQSQLDALNGIDNSIMGVAAAIAAMNASVVAALQGLPKGSAQANTPQNNRSIIDTIYQSVLGRGTEGDEAGAAFWANALQSGKATYQDIAASIAKGAMGNSAESAATKKSAEEYLKGLGIPGFASGGLFGGGLRIVGEKGPELEVTGPSRIYNASQTAAMLGGGDSAAAITSLQRTVEGQSAALRSIAKHTMQTAKRVEFLERWDFDGLPKERATA